MADKSGMIDRRDAALERLFEALDFVLTWDAKTPEATLRQIRTIARAAVDEANQILTSNCNAD